MLRVPGGKSLLPRPIAASDLGGGVLTFLYQVVGRGTSELAALRPGESLELNGPLGNGFPIKNLTGNIALISGGAGIAPMLLTARELRAKGCEIHAFCGFRDEAFMVDKLREHCSGVSVTTESGKSGTRGLITEIFDPKGYSAVLCCAPDPMAKIVTERCAGANVPVYISLEAKMACGIGACLVCTCSMKNGAMKRVCTDGPVFPGGEVAFDA